MRLNDISTPIMEVGKSWEMSPLEIENFRNLYGDDSNKEHLEILGHIGKYQVCKVNYNPRLLNKRKSQYLLYDNDEKNVAGYVTLEPEPIDGYPNALQVTAVYIGREYQKQNLATEFYYWLLQHVTDTLVSGDEQTEAAKKLWIRFYNDPRFFLKQFDTHSEKWVPISDFESAYQAGAILLTRSA